jgi:hypothetical protein
MGASTSSERWQREKHLQAQTRARAIRRTSITEEWKKSHASSSTFEKPKWGAAKTTKSRMKTTTPAPARPTPSLGPSCSLAKQLDEDYSGNCNSGRGDVVQARWKKWLVQREGGGGS